MLGRTSHSPNSVQCDDNAQRLQEPSALQPPDGSLEPLLDAVHCDLERLLGALEPYMHPSNHGSWVHHLSVFLQDTASALAGRAHGVWRRMNR